MLQIVTVARQHWWQGGVVKVATALSLLLVLAPGVARAAGDSRIQFDVLLDGRHVGTHRFDIREAADGARQVRSAAAFDVKFLGFVAYRYRHQADESWNDGCLRQIDATTDDNGKPSRVARSLGEGCVSSYAYWDPQALLRQRALLNPQTGEVDDVRIERMADETLSVRGAKVFAERYRLRSAKLTIDLWYSKQGEWLQLVSTAGAKRELRYRLAATAPTPG
jgi:hypothetical protein